jgi:hypothetical protein
VVEDVLYLSVSHLETCVIAYLLLLLRTGVLLLLRDLGYVVESMVVRMVHLNEVTEGFKVVEWAASL